MILGMVGKVIIVGVVCHLIFGLKRNCFQKLGAPGTEKKAAVGGGRSLGVVDRMNGVGMVTGDPTASDIASPVYLLEGDLGITGGARVDSWACEELCCVGEDEVWDWLTICTGTTTPGTEGNACCGPRGMITGPPAWVGIGIVVTGSTCLMVCCAGLPPGWKNFLQKGFFSFGGGGGGCGCGTIGCWMFVGSTTRAVTVCMVGAWMVFAPLTNLSLCSLFSLISLSRSSSCLLHSSRARLMFVLSLLFTISSALDLILGVGFERCAKVSLYGASSNSFGGGVGGLLRLISGSGPNGLNGGEAAVAEVGVVVVCSAKGRDGITAGSAC